MPFPGVLHPTRITLKHPFPQLLSRSIMPPTAAFGYSIHPGSDTYQPV